MISKVFEPHKKIALVVKQILVIQNDCNKETVLPFYADGYPGIIFQQTENGMLVQPQNKLMPAFFIYGQTIKPIELILNGNYKVIAFKLYPFVLKSFYNLDAEALNDNCYDISRSKTGESTLQALTNNDNPETRIEIITNYLYNLFEEKKSVLDLIVRKAIQIILDNKGQGLVKDIFDKLHITERTFERRFLKETGLPAKQFCQIVQFQQSFEQLTSKEFSRLTDVVYNNGYADQSHFIRVFKAYTGSTPKKFTI